MSQVLWCDVGQHAYPANQPGATTLKVEQQVKNQWGGYQPSDIVQDICRSCANDMGIRQVGKLPEKSDEEIDEVAEAQRDGTFTRNFLRRGRRELTAPAATGTTSADGAVADPVKTAELEGWQRGFSEAAQKFGETV